MNKRHCPDPLMALLTALPTSLKWMSLQYVGRHPAAEVIHKQMIEPGVDAEQYFALLKRKIEYEYKIILEDGSMTERIDTISQYRDLIRPFSMTLYGDNDSWLFSYLDMWSMCCFLN